MKLNLVEKRKTIYLRIFLILLVFVTSNIFALIYDLVLLLSPITFLLPFLIFPHLLYTKIGYVEIDEKQIIIIPNSGDRFYFPFDGSSKYNFIYDSQRSNDGWKKYVVKSIVLLLQIEDKNNKFTDHKIVVRTRDRQQFIEFLKNLYRMGIPVSEKSDIGAKCFLLQTNLKYDEIQKVKNEYNISW